MVLWTIGDGFDRLSLGHCCWMTVNLDHFYDFGMSSWHPQIVAALCHAIYALVGNY